MSKGSFAALTAGLLARKGEAMPAAATFSLEGYMNEEPETPHLTPVPSSDEQTVTSAQPNGPSGSQAVVPVPAPPAPAGPAPVLPPPVQRAPRRPRADKTSASPAPLRLADCATTCDGGPDLPDLASNKRVALTLRLGPTRYFCLKMAAAKTRRTSQDILTVALDRYLESLADNDLGDCSCLRKLIRGEMIEET